MTPLQSTYKKFGYYFELEHRDGDVAIFRQMDEGKVIAYEVFEVLKQEACTRILAGHVITTEAKEVMPSTECWGKNAFTCATLERAKSKVLEINDRMLLQEAHRNQKLATTQPQG